MAHFTDAKGVRISGQTLHLGVGESKEIGLWGYLDFQGNPLSVEVMNSSGDQRSYLASVSLLRKGNNTRFYRVRGLQAGSGRIDARTQALDSWDHISLTVTTSPHPADSITQTKADIAPRRYVADVVDPASVKGSGPLAVTPALGTIRCLMFDVRRGPQKYWVGAAVPDGLADFTHAHVFFHPAPDQQGGPRSADYDKFGGLWSRTEGYVARLGTQLASIGRKDVLLVPFMDKTHFQTLGLLATDPEASISELLAAVQQAVSPGGAQPVLKSLSASSFSVGVTCLSAFVHKKGISRLLKETFDFDGLFSNSPARMMASAPSGIFKKYSQSPFRPGAPGFYVTPLERWKNFPNPPRNKLAVHSLMPDLFLHAISPGPL